MYVRIFAAFFIALLITGAVLLLGRRGPWGAAWTFFLFLFLSLWVVSIYLPGVGPVYWGIAWIPLIVTGVILALLLASAVPGANEWRDKSIRDADTSKVTPVKSRGGIGNMFWILIIVMIVLILIGMMNPQKAL